MPSHMTLGIRIFTTALTCLAASGAFAQVPAGVAYDAKKHPNPIVTWAQEKDFRPVSFVQASELVGVELMSLSRETGERQSVEIATPPQTRQRVRIIGEEYEVTFYPVMRQIYKLKSGSTFTLYTFRFPRALVTAEFLNQAAFGRPPRGTLPRFGTLTLPDRLDIRGNPGLYFDEGERQTVYWFELGAGYSATTDATKDELFDVLEDLL